MNLSERMTRIAGKPRDPRSAIPFAPDAWRGRGAVEASEGCVPMVCWESVEFECEVRHEAPASAGSEKLPGGVLAEMEL